MHRCFIFAIGGTGARVLRSLMFLVASGTLERLKQNWEIVPIILDMDATNQNGNITQSILQDYKMIQSQVGYQNNPNTLFKTKISRLKDVQPQATSVDFTMPIRLGNSASLAEFIDYSDLDILDNLKSTKELVDLLYPDDFKKMNLHEGTKGVPGIGSVVFEGMGDRGNDGQQSSDDSSFNGDHHQHDFRTFMNAYQTGDRIFIIGSLFGGTGSAGIPWLVKTIRDTNLQGTIRNAPIGLLGVMPYFELASKDGGAIDSKTFDTRTKAALAYYSEQLTGIDYAYYIGNHLMPPSFENHEGGYRQYNPANIVELLGASGIIDFMTKGSNDFGGSTVNYRFGLFRDSPDQYQFNFSNFSRGGDDFFKAFTTSLTQLFYTHLLFKNGFPGSKSWQWAANADIDQNAIIDNRGVYEKLNLFLDRFMDWVRELGGYMSGQGAGIGFRPFNLQGIEEVNLETSLLKFVAGFEMAEKSSEFKVLFFTRFRTETMTLRDLIDEVGSVANANLPNNTAPEESRLLEAISLATMKLLGDYRASFL